MQGVTVLHNLLVWLGWMSTAFCVVCDSSCARGRLVFIARLSVPLLAFCTTVLCFRGGGGGGSGAPGAHWGWPGTCWHDWWARW